ncbi:EamA family transporter [Tropicimonas sp. S265A]|uniref:EamA family transporter n=1 Tax=Tropicimonas sp. S265A TaxID=3415134 RepID=UPI003C7B2848
MPLWIPVTIFAAFAQNLRFMLQRHLKVTTLSTGGATFSRFLYSAPLVALIALGYSAARELPLPGFSSAFWGYALVGGLAQILATMCVVALFAERAFAIGITFKKTEVMLTALMGMIVLGEAVSLGAAFAIMVGFVGVVVLSDPPDATGNWRRLFNKGAALGVASGALFGVSAVGYRGASLELASADPFQRAAITLMVVTAFQTLTMALWLRLRERGEIRRVLASWRVSVWVGLSSMLGSLAWFTAFTLQNAAYVKALGQIELVFSFIASTFLFGEQTTRREVLGVLILVVSVLILVLTL